MPPGGPLGRAGKADGSDGVSGVREWYLIGNALTPGNDTLSLRAPAPEGADSIELWIDGRKIESLDVVDAEVSYEGDISDLEAGEHELRLIIVGAEPSEIYAKVIFFRSHPLYVIVTNDWDTSDHPDSNMAREDELRAHHPDLVVTHFVGPYTFTDPELDPARRELLVERMKRLHEERGDEIGLHIHPYCNFVEYAGIPCRTEPTYATSWRSEGYTVFCSAYTEDEFTTLLRTAQSLFDTNGLGTPTSFRAGGWSLEIHTMRALAAAGFVADTSANNWKRLEEWAEHTDATLYPWNMSHWATIDETSQPYYPSETDILASEPPYVPVLEVPDNGILADYVTTDEMIQMFEANWDGGALGAPRQFSIGYHPISYSADYPQRLDGALTHIDQFLAEDDAGPVVYSTLSNVVNVWPLAESGVEQR